MIMKVLEDLMAVAYLRFREASRAQTDSDPTTSGVLAAAARAHADVATAVATHKHTLAAYAADTAKMALDAAIFLPSPEAAEGAADLEKTADELFKQAETAALAAFTSKARAKRLGTW